MSEYRNDQRGYVYIDGIPDGKYKLCEIDAPEGYILFMDTGIDCHFAPSTQKKFTTSKKEG